MRQTSISLLLLLVCLVTAPANGREPVLFGQGLLFRVSAGNTPACHLFGTVHSGEPGVTGLVLALRPVIEKSKVFVMEVIPEADAALESTLAMVYGDGRTLEETIGVELYRRTVRAAERRGFSESTVRDFKPWAVMALLSLPPSAGVEILDLQLYRLSRQLGMEVGGLETLREQLDIFDKLSESDQIRLLKDTLEIQHELPDIFNQVLATYLNQDLDGLMRLSEDYLQSEDAEVARRFQDQVMHGRNRRMAERIEPMLADGGVFVAVGALHLPGEKGILALLSEKGYRVEPVLDWWK